MKVIRPQITLFVLVCLGAACMGLMTIYPKDGIQIGGVKFIFMSWENDSTKQQNKIEDIDQFLAQLDSLPSVIDSLSIDSTLQIQRKTTIASLQFRDGDSSPLFVFFAALDKAKANNERVHIFHYGDSQIESDRMSGVLRQKLQEKFGGQGSGLIAPVPICASANIKQSQSDNWKRYTSYGFDNGKVSHNNYGVMCAFGRFTASKKAEEIVATDSTEAWIELRPSSMAHGNCKNYSEAILYFGNHQLAFTLSIYADEVLLSSESVIPVAGLNSRKWLFDKTPKKLKFVFKGPDSPDVYGIELQGSGGVNLSNIALRGNDGGAFRRVNADGMTTVFADLNASLIILQFGGNAIPYLSSDESAVKYGNAFRSHILQFRKMAPKAAFIIIGPSDMSTSVDGVYQTWPHLEALRDGMKQAALDEGCAFWDIYDVMGGKNSMVSWVTNNPPYAGPDYTHFTPAGARKVAELLHKAIMDEYDAWKNASVSLP